MRRWEKEEKTFMRTPHMFWLWCKHIHQLLFSCISAKENIQHERRCLHDDSLDGCPSILCNLLLSIWIPLRQLHVWLRWLDKPFTLILKSHLQSSCLMFPYRQVTVMTFTHQISVKFILLLFKHVELHIEIFYVFYFFLYFLHIFCYFTNI